MRVRHGAARGRGRPIDDILDARAPLGARRFAWARQLPRDWCEVWHLGGAARCVHTARGARDSAMGDENHVLVCTESRASRRGARMLVRTSELAEPGAAIVVGTVALLRRAWKARRRVRQTTD